MLNNVQSHGIRLLAVSWAFVLVCSLSPCEAGAQTDSVAWYGQRKGLVAPLNIPLVLAGNFGELRDDHFHRVVECSTPHVPSHEVALLSMVHSAYEGCKF